MLGCPSEPSEIEPDLPPAAASDPVHTSQPMPLANDPEANASLPEWADWPVENVAPKSWFGWRLDPSGQYVREAGLRFTTTANLYVLAIASGSVRSTTRLEDGSTQVEIDHGGGLVSRYQALSACLVYAGMPVRRGTALGFAQGAELLLEVSQDGRAIDPLWVLRTPLRSHPD